jgi:hypothetical protein
VIYFIKKSKMQPVAAANNNPLLAFIEMRVQLLNALLRRLQAEKKWWKPKDAVHFLCVTLLLGDHPWALLMYLGSEPPKRGEFNYVASIVPDDTYYAAVALGMQAIVSGDDAGVKRFGSHEELVVYLRSLVGV